MIDEEKIKLMTRMASFEANEGEKMIPITQYFRSDYVGLNMLKTAVGVTLSFLLVVGVWLFCQFETLIEEFYQTDFVSIARRFVNIYLVVLILYVVFAYVLYSYRYTQAKKHVRIYHQALKRLSAMNERQTR